MELLGFPFLVIASWFLYIKRQNAKPYEKLLSGWINPILRAIPSVSVQKRNGLQSLKELSTNLNVQLDKTIFVLKSVTW